MAFAGTSTVESDFLIVKWEKDDCRIGRGSGFEVLDLLAHHVDGFLRGCLGQEEGGAGQRRH